MQQLRKVLRSMQLKRPECSLTRSLFHCDQVLFMNSEGLSTWLVGRLVIPEALPVSPPAILNSNSMAGAQKALCVLVLSVRREQLSDNFRIIEPKNHFITGGQCSNYQPSKVSYKLIEGSVRL